jgi:multicomponent Na+:H+ antiporter subunit D
MGMAYTGDLFNFFVFLEVTSIAACGIIGFRTWTSRAPEAAFKTMLLYSPKRPFLPFGAWLSSMVSMEL